jgi:uncharacterized membrane protein
MTTASPLIKQRINSIDLLRGIVMIIMALDHVRDYFHIHAFDDDPLNLATTTPALYFTRFITHYCAPTFVFLSGTSIYLQSLRKTKKELSRFLLARGLWLMLLEIVIVNLFWSFNPLYNFIGLQVIWVIGLSMVIMSAIIFLPLEAVLVLGLVLVCGHNVLDSYDVKNASPSVWWGLFHQQSFFPYAKERLVAVFYPLIPWPGVMMLGYCLGKWYTKDFDAAKRTKYLLITGSIALVVFVVVRYTNKYGDANHWTKQRDGVYTLLSFLNVVKYPPSLLYLCITLGPSIIALALLEKAKGAWQNFVMVFGKVPMFYYLCHIFLIHFIEVVFFYATGHHNNEIIDQNVPFLFRPLHYGFNLLVVYSIWISVIIILYPFCKKYSEYKANNPQKKWLSYL